MNRSFVLPVGAFAALALAIVTTPSCGSSSSCTELPCGPGAVWLPDVCACSGNDASANDGAAIDAHVSSDDAGDAPAESSGDSAGDAPSDTGSDSPAGDAASDAPSDAPPETSIPD